MTESTRELLSRISRRCHCNKNELVSGKLEHRQVRRKAAEILFHEGYSVADVSRILGMSLIACRKIKQQRRTP